MAANDPKTSRSSRGVSRTADRLASRASRGMSPQKGQLERSAMPGGGEVFGGDLASRALKTLGARAMTVDKSIIVADDFNPGRAEDQALFAHEQFHVDHSGGQGSHQARDGEEVAARAVERMVLHRSGSGGGESRAVSRALASPDEELPVANDNAPGPEGGSAQRGYGALLAQGYTHDAILDHVARQVIESIEQSRESANHRYADKKGFL